MKLEPSPGFIRDLKRVRNPDLQRRVEQAIAALEAAASVTEVPGIRKITSASGRHYRIRIGNYRLGIAIEGDVTVLVTFGHRREFYRRFP